MKYCPNCGAKIVSHTENCTNCGANLAQSVKENENGVQSRVEYTENIKKAVLDGFEKISGTAKSLDKENFGNWLVTSWKHPFAEQKGEKWYGEAIIIVELILNSISLLLGTNMFISTTSLTQEQYDRAKLVVPTVKDLASKYNHILTWDLIGISTIIILVIIFTSWEINKYIYGNYMLLHEHINRIVHISSYTLILFALSFLASVVNKGKADSFIYFMETVAIILIFVAGIVTIKNGTDPIRSKKLGVIIYIVGIIILALILIGWWGLKSDDVLNELKTQYQNEIREILGY